jgi:hypothetical protein
MPFGPVDFGGQYYLDVAVTRFSGLALSAALHAIIGKMEDQRLTPPLSGTGRWLVPDSRKDRPPAGREIERKPVFVRSRTSGDL